MKTPNKIVYTGLQIIAWIIFVGLCIEAGAIITNLVISLWKPTLVSKLYEHIDLSTYYVKAKPIYFGIYSYLIFISVLKAYLFYVVIQLVTKLDLENPFNEYVSNKIRTISGLTFSIGILSYIMKNIVDSVMRYGTISGLEKYWVDSTAFIIMSAILFILAYIFHKGLALQTENELTV